MNGENDKITEFKKKNRKRAIIFLSVTIALVIILPIITFVDFGKKDVDTDKDSWIKYYDDKFFTEPKFDEIIEDDKKYMQLDRTLYYSDGTERFSVSERTSEFGPCCTLFYDYFEKVKTGDFQNYYSLFTERYVNEHGNINFFTKKNLVFTKQKIYSIDVILVREYKVEEGDYSGSTVYEYKVSYKIKDNNGTFRRDILSDETVPLMFQLIKTGDTVKINDISFYRHT